MRLAEKVIIVTGSSAGIGEAIARRCVAEGARVVVHGLEQELVEKVSRELGERSALCCNDLSRAEAADELVAAAMAAFGRIDGLVNNAATVARSNIETTDPATFDRVMAINVRAPLLMIRAALPHLRRPRGAVVNIGSVNAYCGEPNLLAYSISKGGLMTLTRNLADALAHEGVRVNQINPGWVLTENEYRQKIADGLPPDWVERLPHSVAPSGKLLAPDDIARMVVYWLGDESRPITGSVVDANQYPVIGRNPPKEVT